LPAYDPSAVAEIVDVLAPTCDAVLVGEHQNRPDLPPALMAALIKERGVRPWITLTCRDRNRVVLEQELQGLAALGGVGVFCATGDGRAPGVRDEVTQVFDIDGTRLAGMAAHNGLAVGVPEGAGRAAAHLRPGACWRSRSGGAGGGAQPRRYRRTAGRVRGRGARDRGAAAVRGGRRGLHRRAIGRGAAALPRASAWTPSGWRACSPRPTRWRPGARRRCGRPGLCSRSRGSSGSTSPGLATGRGERAGAEIKAAIGAEISAGIRGAA
jgi:hypothetical protein